MNNTPKINIIIADSSNLYQKLFQKIIENKLSARTTLIANQEELFDCLYGSKQYDLLLVDPLIFQDEVKSSLEKIKADSSLETLPIIVTSDNEDLDKNSEYLDHGANDFIAKDSSPGVIISRINSQLRRRMALTRLNQLAVDRDLFAAGVLHDIRNIETSIRLVCEFTNMKLDKDPVANKDDITKNLDLLISSASKLGTYASEIIQSVRRTDRKISLEPLNLSETLTWASEVMTSQSSQQQGLSISWSAEDKLLPVKADKEFIKLAIFNIVQNAIKYRQPETTAKLEITQTVEEPNSSVSNQTMIITQIRDFGLGVGKNELEKVFKPFQRGSSQSDTEGFGLGLSMVTKVIGKMGGQVWAEHPANGEGLIICLKLPKA
jgi:signal transduction histidine kinase